MSDFRNETEPTVDRFKDNTSGPRGSHTMEELEGFTPTSVGSERDSGGWLRTTAPEGVPLSSLLELQTSGSRGAEGKIAETKRLKADDLGGSDS